ncbi:MAG: glycosyltransferase family 39 protein [Kiritimatiellae bacterium]|nr:glycosyltransferase family 39 protein [Kiritimatiellia bacterium]
MNRQEMGTGWKARPTWPLLVGVVLPVVGRTLGRAMFDAPTGNRAGVLLTLFPLFGCNILMTPDTLYALCWALALLYAWRALESAERGVSRWLMAGLCAGAELLSKYTMILFFPGLGILWLLRPEKRRSLLLGGLLAGMVGLACFLPVVIWNVRNGWASFTFQLGHGFSATSRNIATRLAEYVGGLIGLATPALGGLAFWSAARAVRAGDRQRRFLTAFFWAQVLFFLVSAMRTRVGPNWSMLAFFSVLLLVAADWRLCARKWRVAALALLLAAWMALCAVGTYRVPPDALHLRIGGKPVDMARMEEFRGGAGVADAVRRQLKSRLYSSAPHLQMTQWRQSSWAGGA